MNLYILILQAVVIGGAYSVSKTLDCCRGPRGHRGPTGPVGLKGEPGVKGQMGPQGERGDVGTGELMTCANNVGGYFYYSDGEIVGFNTCTQTAGYDFLGGSGTIKYFRLITGGIYKFSLYVNLSGYYKVSVFSEDVTDTNLGGFFQGFGASYTYAELTLVIPPNSIVTINSVGSNPVLGPPDVSNVSLVIVRVGDLPPTA